MFASLAWLLPAIAALFGLLIGSFLNVCIHRIIRDQSVIFPASYCPECGESILWFDNIPVVSYLLLLGRCRHCRQPISFRYPIVEILTSLLFAALAARYGWQPKLIKWCVFEAVLVTLSFTDLEERLLPDELTLGGSVLGILLAAVVPAPGLFSELFVPHASKLLQSLLESTLGALVLSLPVWCLAAFWGRLRGREMLGLGDVKLLALIGAFLAVENGIAALLIGSVAGVLLGGGFILLQRKKAGEYELPFGAFLCLGAGMLPLLRPL